MKRGRKTVHPSDFILHPYATHAASGSAPSGPTMATMGVHAGELSPRCVYQNAVKCTVVPGAAELGMTTMIVSRVTLPSHFQSGEPASGAVSPMYENKVAPAALMARP